MVSAFAPATIAVSGTLLDSFGFAIEGIGDIVRAELTDEFQGAKLVKIENNSNVSLPVGKENVVEAVGQKLLEYAKSKNGVKLILEKNMGIGTGMGSSASSGVATAVAANEAIGRPFQKDSI